MKTWRCDACKQERITNDNIVIATCRCCVEWMRLVEQQGNFKLKEEINNG